MKKNFVLFFLISMPTSFTLAQAPAPTKPKAAPIKIVVPQKNAPTSQTSDTNAGANSAQTNLKDNGFETKSYEAGEFFELSAVGGNGNLTISKSPNQTTTISVSRPKIGSRCQLQMIKKEDSASMLVRSASTSGDTCPMDGNISLPEGIEVKASLESGNLKIVDVKNISELTLGSGEITYEGNSAEPHLTIKRGSIYLERWNSSAIIKVLENANVKCNFSTLPPMGTFSIESREGNIELNIPKSFPESARSDYSINFKTEMGEFSVKRF